MAKKRKAVKKPHPGLTSRKAREILHDGTVHGRPITDRQRRFFGAVSSESRQDERGSMRALKTKVGW